MDVFSRAAAAVGGMMGDHRRVSVTSSDQHGDNPASAEGRERERDGTHPRERTLSHESAGVGVEPSTRPTSAAASRAASGATSPVLHAPGGNSAHSGDALELQDAVDLIAELTNALHESEAERRELAERHEAERRQRKLLETQMSVTVAQIMPLAAARPPAQQALDGLIEFGVNGVNAGAEQRGGPCACGLTHLTFVHGVAGFPVMFSEEK